MSTILPTTEGARGAVNLHDLSRQLHAALNAAGYPTSMVADGAKLGLNLTRNVVDNVRQLEAACNRLGVPVPSPVPVADVAPTPIAVLPPTSAPPVAVDEAEGKRLLAERYARMAEAEAATKTETKAPKTEKKTTTKAQHRPGNRPGAVSAPTTYNLTRDYFKMTNGFADDLLAAMSGPVVKAYVLGHRYADINGKFWCSYGTLAERIGARSPRHARRVMDRLRQAGLVKLLSRGAWLSDTSREA